MASLGLPVSSATNAASATGWTMLCIMKIDYTFLSRKGNRHE
jgi:hypothetical protein